MSLRLYHVQGGITHLGKARVVSHILLLLPLNNPVLEEGSCAETTEQGSLQPCNLNFLSLNPYPWPDTFITFIHPMLPGVIESTVRFPFALGCILPGFFRSPGICNKSDKTVTQIQTLALFTELGTQISRMKCWVLEHLTTGGSC